MAEQPTEVKNEKEVKIATASSDAAIEPKEKGQELSAQFQQLHEIFKVRGIFDTFTVLWENQSHLTYSEFCDKMNGQSYYNAWLRVRDKLYKANLAEPYFDDNRVKCIRLTEEGKAVVLQLIGIAEILS